MRPNSRKAMEKKFKKKLHHLMIEKPRSKQFMSKKEYLRMVKKVKEAKDMSANWETEDQPQCLKKYDVVKVGRTKKLIAPLQDEDGPLYYVHSEELFDILHKLHLRMRHGSSKRMSKELKSKYKNISRDICRIYVKSCSRCVLRARAQMEEEDRRRSANKDNQNRGQVECLRMYPCGTSPMYNTLMMYHDNINHYDVARPLVAEKVEKIAQVLCDIFALFGTPDILQTTTKGNFITRIVKNIKRLRPEINIEPEKVVFDDSWKTMGPDVIVGRDPKDLNIGDIFTSWTFEVANRLESRISDVVEGRSAGRSRDERVPYDAMFVRNLKTSPRWSHLSGYVLDKIKAENLAQNRKPPVRLYNKCNY